MRARVRAFCDSVHARAHARAHEHARARPRIRTRTRMHTHTYTRTHTHTHTATGTTTAAPTTTAAAAADGPLPRPGPPGVLTVNRPGLRLHHSPRLAAWLPKAQHRALFARTCPCASASMSVTQSRLHASLSADHGRTLRLPRPVASYCDTEGALARGSERIIRT
jgi:hypothetical protein